MQLIERLDVLCMCRGCCSDHETVRFLRRWVKLDEAWLRVRPAMGGSEKSLQRVRASMKYVVICFTRATNACRVAALSWRVKVRTAACYSTWVFEPEMVLS